MVYLDSFFATTLHIFYEVRPYPICPLSGPYCLPNKPTDGKANIQNKVQICFEYLIVKHIIHLLSKKSNS